jgi:hypothetical protein
MNEVEDVVTDSDGRFEFKSVPKGGYTILYKNKYALKKVLNCEAAVTAMDVGDLILSIPYRYEVEMIHKGGRRSGLKLIDVKWPEIIIRPLGDNVPLAILIASDDDPGEGRPVDQDGNPLTVPYKVKFPGYPQYDRIFYGVDLGESTPTEISIANSYGLNCHIEQSADAPNGIYLDYGELPGSAIPFPRPLAHHFEIDLAIKCGPMQELFQFKTGHKLAESPNHYSSLLKTPDDMLDHWRKCEDFDKEFSNSEGGKLTLKFTCLGPENLDSPADPPGGCDEFEEDCGDDDDGGSVDNPPGGCDEFEEDCGGDDDGGSAGNPPGGGMPPGGFPGGGFPGGGLGDGAIGSIWDTIVGAVQGSN